MSARDSEPLNVAVATLRHAARHICLSPAPPRLRHAPRAPYASQHATMLRAIYMPRHTLHARAARRHAIANGAHNDDAMFYAAATRIAMR